MTDERKREYQKEYEKKTNYAAQKKYKKEKSRRVSLDFFYNTEQDLLDKLASVDNKSGYIKELIRQDMQNNGGQ
jgi:GH18 family chitinase